ncbi:MAG: hypothetical protein IAE80_19420 [Anaerolinea sp.]|nr:hypothetical protein [Anaerolinea sp.]
MVAWLRDERFSVKVADTLEVLEQQLVEGCFDAVLYAGLQVPPLLQDDLFAPGMPCILIAQAPELWGHIHRCKRRNPNRFHLYDTRETVPVLINLLDHVLN